MRKRYRLKCIGIHAYFTIAIHLLFLSGSSPTELLVFWKYASVLLPTVENGLGKYEPCSISITKLCSVINYTSFRTSP